MLTLIFQNQVEAPFPQAMFEELIRKTETFVDGISEEEVEFALLDDESIQEINYQSRGLDKPTDVLSFANREVEDVFMKDDTSLGQIFISVPAAQRNADEMKQSLEEEVRFLFVHGLLHILGYDHQEKEEEIEMMTLAYQILGRPAYVGD